MADLTCTSDGCDLPQRHPRRQVCHRCYQEAWKAGQLDMLYPMDDLVVSDDIHDCSKHQQPCRSCHANCGCRCDGCRQAHANYERDRRRARAYGRWAPYVDAAPVTEHLRTVMAPPRGALEGAGRRTVAAATGVAESTVAAVVQGRRRRLRRETANALMGFNGRPVGAAKVSSAQARRQLAKMVDAGFTPTELARYVTGSVTAKSTVVTAMRQRITAARADTVDQLHRRWRDGEIVPRGRASRHEYGPPSPYPATIRTPGVCVDCGDPSLGGGLRCLPCFQAAADPRPAPSWDPRCGTPAGYMRHHNAGEKPCQTCRDARTSEQKARRAAA